MSTVTAGVQNKVIHGDCLTESEQIASGSVDLILTDPPYGNMKNAPSTWDKMKTEWDETLNPIDIYSIANRILRKNGKMVLFSQEPYTTELINSAMSNVPLSYRAIWEKDSFANGLGCNKNMVGFYEDILVFSKCSGAIEKMDYSSVHPLRKYFNDELMKSGKTASYFIELCGSSASHYFTDGNQFRLPTKDKYLKLQDCGHFNRCYDELRTIHEQYCKIRESERLNYLSQHNSKYPSTFNLWEGKKYKSNILKYSKDYEGYHPTQKPVLLLEDLIKTFSNECDLIVDLTAGSGSTAIACINTGRRYVVIEKEEKYYNIINKRISEHELQVTLC